MRKGLSSVGAVQGQRRALSYSAIAGLMAAMLSGLVAFGIERTAHQQREIEARQLATVVAHDLGGRLDRSLSAVTALTAVLRQGNGKVDHFALLAEELIGQFGGITALQLAPGGTISEVEPRAGHERVIGFNPLDDPIQGPEARLVVDSRQLGLTGPFELRQGGTGIVGRNPVFLKDAAGNEQFWGLVQVLIRVPDLLVATRLDAIERAGYRYELWRLQPASGERQVFARSSDQPLNQPVEIPIAVPNGEWVLSVAPDAGWHSGSRLLIDVGVVALISLLAALAVYFAWRQKVSPDAHR